MFTSIHLALILHHLTLYKYEQNEFLPVRLIWFCFCQLLSCSHVFFVCSKVGWCIKTCKVALFHTETGKFTKQKKSTIFSCLTLQQSEVHSKKKFSRKCGCFVDHCYSFAFPTSSCTCFNLEYRRSKKYISTEDMSKMDCNIFSSRIINMVEQQL